MVALAATVSTHTAAWPWTPIHCFRPWESTAEEEEGSPESKPSHLLGSQTGQSLEIKDRYPVLVSNNVQYVGFTVSVCSIGRK